MRGPVGFRGFLFLFGYLGAASVAAADLFLRLWAKLASLEKGFVVLGFLCGA